MPYLTLGNRIDGESPLRGKMRMFRMGDRLLSEYEYDTLDLTKINPDAVDAPKHVVVDEVQRFFDRAQKGAVGVRYTDPRMTTGAVIFAPMEEDGDYTNHYFYRDSAELNIFEVSDGYRTWGAQTADQESVGLRFSLRQMEHGSDAYFDNARFEVSNILWEFSPDGGHGRWYKLYELPNRKDTRITLPNATNQIKLRAISNNPDEWVQAVAITPRVDWLNASVGAVGFGEYDFDASTFEVDEFGYAKWEPADGGSGNFVYVLNKGDGSFEKTRNVGYAPGEHDSVVSVDAYPSNGI